MHLNIEAYLANHVDTISLDKGLVMYKNGNAKLANMDRQGAGHAQYKVRSNSNKYNTYVVSLAGFMNGGTIRASCSCPYDWGGACKHIVSSLLELDELDLDRRESVVFQMLDCEVALEDLRDAQLQSQTSIAHWKLLPNLPKASVISAENGVASCSVKYGKDTFTLRFTRIAPGRVHSSCSCAQQLADPLCLHKLAALIALREQFGMLAFETMRDRSVEKNELLAPYGFTAKDDLNGKFEFQVKSDGQLQLKVLDHSIRSTTELKNWWENVAPKIDNKKFKVPALTQEERANEQILLFAFTQGPADSLFEMSLTPLTARYQEAKDKISHIARFDAYNAELPAITPQDSRLIQLARKRFDHAQISQAIRNAGLPSPNWIYNLSQKDMSNESVRVAQEYIGSLWEQIFPMLTDKFCMFSPNDAFHVSSMRRVHINPLPATIHLLLRQEKDQYILECQILVDGTPIATTQLERHGFWLLAVDSLMTRFATWRDAALYQQFGLSGQIAVRSTLLEPFLEDFVLPLTQYFGVDFELDQPISYQRLHLKAARIYLKEEEENLLFVPAFVYSREDAAGSEEFEFSSDGRGNRVSYIGGELIIWERDAFSEKEYTNLIKSLHPDFEGQSGQSFFHLPFGDVLKNSWLHRFFEEVKAREIEVFGFAQLKKFKYNPNRPAFKIKASSGIDWFDMKMEISFGDQTVSLKDIKKAVVNKQNYVALSDGSIGMLPEEWLEKHAALFKFGDVKGDSLQLSKMHFSMIDEFYDQLDDEKVRQEIQEKKQKLLHFKEMKAVNLPKNARADLRNYQLEGYKWLGFLEEFKWGGCLADDMGLGKTLQVLTFLQGQKETKTGATNLVVVPTTLIFNWQAEVEKFAPEMRVFVHRGVGRSKNTAEFRNYDIVLTTYGTLRSDIEYLKDFPFHYVVLDESQAIKNPQAQVSKAVKLLSANNRLVMTGTPVENNTFDLYSQMDFLNPGLLGSQEFFRSEFATPIDKNRDEHAARALRKLIYPFILKRTKDEVAKDLPDKTEMTLFCEMGKKQRKVYDTFREMYRQKIADKITSEGKDKAAFLILEGLLKLRQICDSPALLSDDTDYGDESAKLDEIIREIEENAGHHKILVFSQFLKMLDLIRQHLVKAGIPYEYLDGSTQDRAQRVSNFQDSEHCRVFLMSLKAGGVGINLTEADYVYLIDPWWNPAVEQQAIDRAHRIGQTKKVFAYKMICKDTIEEKILLLQEKKKGIAQELISTEQGFIKKLTKEDIIGLFS